MVQIYQAGNMSGRTDDKHSNVDGYLKSILSKSVAVPRVVQSMVGLRTTQNDQPTTRKVESWPISINIIITNIQLPDLVKEGERCFYQWILSMAT